MSALVKKTTSLAAAVVKDNTKQTVSSLDTETLIICIDTSGSMRDYVKDGQGESEKMKVAIEAAKSLINASGILSHIGAVAFSDKIGEEVPPSVSRGQLTEKLSGFSKYEGGTEFSPPVKRAVSIIAAHKWGAVKRIIFMSDGDDTGDPEWLFSSVSECVASKIIIDTVMFGSSPVGEATLRNMSSRTGGIFCLAKDAATLRRTFLLLEGKARGLLGKGKP